MSHQSELISSDIHAYLSQHEHKELLRFLTCGSVDDGKSTLIGRLLHDSKMIYEDQLAAINRDSLKLGSNDGNLDLALLVDGLQAEREQGITIDVAYRYFSTARRKFIIADSPGHEQYTRNMATGASTCDLAIILVDARRGVQTQTKRHSFIVSLLGIRQVIVAINKMDLVDYSEAVFKLIRQNYLDFAEKLNIPDIRFLPLSALKGDNVVNPSEHMTWYEGPVLMELLDSIEISRTENALGLRFPVQYVNRPNLDFRGYSGSVAAGIVRKGDPVIALPSGRRSRVKSIVTYDGELDEAFPPQAVTLTLEDEIDVSRGDMLVGADAPPQLDSRFKAQLVWMTDNPMVPGKQYLFKQATRIVTGSVSRILHRTDVNTLDEHEASQLRLNEIGLCEIALSAPIAFDAYASCKGTGAFILIDRLTHVTVGAGMIESLADPAFEAQPVSRSERAARFGQRAVTVWLTGSHREEAAHRLDRRLFDRGFASFVLSEETPGLESAAFARGLNAAGLICICTLDSRPDREDGENFIVPAETLDVNEIIGKIGLPADEVGPPDFSI